MSVVVKPECPSDETLALFASGGLDAQTRMVVLEHLERCSECMAAVLAADAHLQEEAAPRHGIEWRWWMSAVAAAVLIAIVLIPFLARRRDPIAGLVAVAPTSERVVEPRLSGGFAWAPYRGSARGSDAAVDTERMRVAGAAAKVIEHGEHDASAPSQHAAGVALVLTGHPRDALDRLTAAANASAKDPKPWIDLSAARYAAAVQARSSSMLTDALTAADRALAIDPRSPEALFDRALIVERLGITAEARKAWTRYLEVDPGSPWAAEARAHLHDLPASTSTSTFTHDRLALETAAAANDLARLRPLVDRYRQQARTYAEGEYLGQWGAAEQQHDTVAATRWLTMARAVGAAIHDLSGESLLRDAVAAIDSAPSDARATLAQGHVLYRQGRIAYSRQSPAAGERDLRLAAARFDQGRSPMALLAGYYAASARLAQSDIDGARRELEQCAADADAHPQYIALGASIDWELGRAHTMADDWIGALPLLSQGAARFRRLGEHSGEAFIESMRAGALLTLGRQDESWDARIRAFQALSADGDSDRLARSALAAMDAGVRNGNAEAALSLCDIARDLSASVAQPLLAIDILDRKSLLETRLGRTETARTTAAEADAVARQIADPALRQRMLADVAVAKGAALETEDPRRSIAIVSDAIAFYRSHALRGALPEPLLLRGRDALRVRDIASAKRDFDEGLATVEQRRGAPSDGLPATGVMAAERGLYQEAIRLALDERNPSAAFGYAERARGGHVTLREMQQRLDGSGAVVLEVITLPHEIVSIAVGARDVLVGRASMNEEQAAALARASSGKDALSALSALYDAIVRPVDRALASAERVIIVADPSLEGVPFAALFDAVPKRYLIERMAVAIAPSAASLVRDARPRRATSLVAVDLPSGGDAPTNALPESEEEVRDIATLYAHAVRIPPDDATWSAFAHAMAGGADVVHIAGHAERQEGAGDSALLFAGGSGNPIERVSWRSVAAAPHVAASIVVLAACETLRRPQSANTRALTLAEAFTAAGAHEVAGTLVPIADHDARVLFREFHRYVASGDDAVDALRRVQVDAIHGEMTRGFPAWAAVSVLTTRIHQQHG